MVGSNETASLIIHDYGILLNKWPTVHNAAQGSNVTGITDDGYVTGHNKSLSLQKHLFHCFFLTKMMTEVINVSKYSISLSVVVGCQADNVRTYNNKNTYLYIKRSFSNPTHDDV